MNKSRQINTKENVKTVTSNTFITARGLEELSLNGRKLLYIAISQCKLNDKQFYSYEITVSDLAKILGVTTQAVYKEADKVTDELMRSVLRIAEQNSKYFIKYSLFSKCEYRNGLLTIKLNPDMTDFLLQLKGDFSKPLLNDFMKMKSNYSMAIWHLMQREMRSHKPLITEVIEFDLSLEELREVTGTQNKLKQLGQFKEKCFDKALREIFDNCGVKITYDNIKRGRTVIGFRCKAVSILYINEEQIPQRTKDKVLLFKLKQTAQTRTLTKKEQAEYNRLIEIFE